MGKAGQDKRGRQEVGAQDSRESSSKQPIMNQDLGDGKGLQVWRYMVGQGGKQAAGIEMGGTDREEKTGRNIQDNT